MRVGSVEGTPEEVKNLFENHGLNLSEYIEKPDPPLGKLWLCLPSVCLVVCFGVLSILTGMPNNAKIFLFLLGFASSVWLAVAVHVRFKSMWGSGALILAGLLIMLVALGVIEPIELIDYYKGSNA